MPKRLSIEDLENGAHDLRETGRPRQEMKVIERLFLRDKDNLTGLFQAVLVQLDLHQPKVAVKFGKRLVHLYPDECHAWVNLGAAFERCDQQSRAIDCYRRELERYPQSKPANYNLGKALYRRRQWEEALRHLWACVVMRHSFCQVKGPVARCLEKLGRLDEEIAFYERCILEDSADGWAYHNLGSALMSAGNERRALIQLRTAQQKGFNEPCLYRNLKRLEKFRQSILKERAAAKDSSIATAA